MASYENSKEKQIGLFPALRRDIHIPSSATSEILEKMQKVRASRKHICELGFGENPLPIPKRIIDALKAHASLSYYPPMQGIYETRKAISDFYNKHYDLDLDVEHIVLYPGAKFALYELLAVLKGPLLLPRGSSMSYQPQADILDKKVVWLPTQREDDWKLRPSVLDAFASAFGREAQKILILNSPNNPTGHIYSKQELVDLAAVCKQQNILVIFDGIYGFPKDFSGKKWYTMAHVYPEGTLLTAGISKIFGAGGWRFGFASLPRDNKFKKTKEALIYRMSETLNGVCVPIQKAAEVAYSDDTELLTTMKVNHQVFKIAVGYVRRRLLSLGLFCPAPLGSFYLFPDFSPFKEKLRRLDLLHAKALGKILIKEGLFMLPGESFGLFGEEYAFRLACIDFDGHEVWEVLTSQRRIEITDAFTDAFVEKHMVSLRRFCHTLEVWMQERGLLLS